MKLIDLLNKIANGEEIPKKIAIQNKVLICNEDKILNLQDYYYMEDDEDATWEIWAYKIDDEVEIIEEKEDTPKEDKKIKRLGKCFFTDYDDVLTEWITMYNGIIVDKLNEIIDRLNGE